jgi:transcriptional regulator with GAF, ATPase, and Fis domain
VIPVVIPPLRDRSDDILPLTQSPFPESTSEEIRAARIEDAPQEIQLIN